MSRSLGLREDQREGEVLATLIFGLFPVDPVWCVRLARKKPGPVGEKPDFVTDQRRCVHDPVGQGDVSAGGHTPF
ncbi:hypothetical protein D3C80_2005710 [compost metagenome]|uniref:hypothetical protein n=1 Tax=Pseudomonas sp. PLMAX TaxID=2201998 RepID=UPI000FB8BE62